MSTEAAAEPKVDEQLPADPPAGEVPPVEKTDEQKKAETRAYSQEEVDKILAKVRKNERYRTRKEVEAFYQGRESAAKPAGDGKREEKRPEGPPTRDQYPDMPYEEFVAFKADWHARKATREESEKVDQESSEKTARESRAKVSGDFQAKTREKFPDIEALIEDVGDAPMYTGVQDAIMESPLGPDIFHELLKAPKEFDRLMSLSQAAAIREIGKLEARLEAKAPKAETKDGKSASKAPAPIAPPGGSSASSSDMPSDNDSTDEWMRKENARLAKLRK